eukprot:TRINITY_DN25433_c0_g1_i2.p1 TRINITY_DN25433_c0_g1~~TRINITY_DN25433_c0_g1_i2.p1  ORF type:complete len:236 (-),score=15.73 TRINITY_DN25433_c0_g1_i2:142-849(-)
MSRSSLFESDGDSSDSESDGDSSSIGEPEPFHRQTRERSTRKPLEERTTHWRFIRHPAFQQWAHATFISGRAQPIPSVLIKSSCRHPAPEQLLQAPVVLERTTSDVPQSSIPPSPGNYRFDAEGRIQTFICPPDARGCKLGNQASSYGPNISGVTQGILDDALKQRASEQCMPLYINSFVQRQQLRVANPGTNQSAERRAVVENANHFDQIYSQTRDAMQGRLHFQPPRRSNTIR